MQTILKSPNKHKKSQLKLYFLYYYSNLKLNFQISKKVIKNFFIFFLLINNINIFINFFESSLLILQKKKFYFDFYYNSF